MKISRVFLHILQLSLFGQPNWQFLYNGIKPFFSFWEWNISNSTIVFMKVPIQTYCCYIKVQVGFFSCFLLTKRIKNNNIFCRWHRTCTWAGHSSRLTCPVAVAHKKWELILSSSKSFQTSGEAYPAQS